VHLGLKLDYTSITIINELTASSLVLRDFIDQTPCKSRLEYLNVQSHILSNRTSLLDPLLTNKHIITLILTLPAPYHLALQVSSPIAAP
jgi:hypothetical protein